MNIYSKIGCVAPDILVPKKGLDLEKWAIIACDQYTSEYKFWHQAETLVGDAPSTLRLILPEYYLPLINEEQLEERLAGIKDSAESYLKEDVFAKLPAGFILTDRSTSLHPSRKGIIIAIDLEAYSFKPEDKALVRATEGTVLDRIPPRVRIRSNSPVELPHVMLLIDDPEGSVVEKAWQSFDASSDELLYDTDLMQDCGHIKGAFVQDGTDIAKGIVSSLERILDSNDDNLLFLVGDGNHSLASAKAYWESVRESVPADQREQHPARYALVEVVNIHDKGLDFEPIHRLVFNVRPDEIIAKVEEEVGRDNIIISSHPIDEGETFTIVADKQCDKFVSITGNCPHALSVGSVQMILDKAGFKTDYIHGEESVRDLAKNGNTGILLPDISKDSFFETVSKNGVFPRKTFSMGEAFEKRFYLEARLIRK